jgi:hypothetical protein
MARLVTGLGACLVAALVSGCSVGRALESGPRVQISSIKAGVTRAQVEERVGTPLEAWASPTGVQYCTYHYVEYEPNLRAAAGLVVMNVLTVGVFEVYVGEGIDVSHEQRIATLAVSYDQNDVVLGVFPDIGERKDLPDDGLPAPAR